jgi:hypothetical protein
MTVSQLGKIGGISVIKVLKELSAAPSKVPAALFRRAKIA